jgi:hypothetical protein
VRVLQEVRQAAQEDVLDGATERHWADQTRRVLTRDLLLRAVHARPAECHALQFRALHLNLPLVGEVADRLGLTEAQRHAVEPAALDGLVEAIRAFDPDGTEEFADFAVTFVERQVLAHLPRPALRLTQPRQPTQEAGGSGPFARPHLGSPRGPGMGVRLAVRRVALVIAGSHLAHERPRP